MLNKTTELGIGCTFEQAVDRFNAIFRGFCANGGKDIIKVGDAYYQGTWVYWSEYGVLLTSIEDRYQVTELILLPETIGQFVKFDSEGVAIFKHDVVEIRYITSDGGDETETREVTYDKAKCEWNPFSWSCCCDACDYSLEIKSIKKVGSIYDMQEKD